MAIGGSSAVGGVREPQPAPQKEQRFSMNAIAELEEIATHYPERKARSEEHTSELQSQ